MKLNILTISTNLKSFEKIKIIIEKYKNIYGTFGIHPHETEKNTDILIVNLLLKIKKKIKKL